MSMRMNRAGYEAAVKEDIEWLLKQPRTLEREHVIAILVASVEHEYPPLRTCGCQTITCDECLMEQSAYHERNSAWTTKIF
jgi:hypothetical protein